MTIRIGNSNVFQVNELKMKISTKLMLESLWKLKILQYQDIEFRRIAI